MNTTTYSVGDTLPTYDAKLRQRAGTAAVTAIDLSDATNLTFIMRRVLRRSSSIAIERAATIVNPAEGEVSFTWAPGDLSTRGTFTVEWRITFAGGRVMTVPSRSRDRIVVR